MLKEFREFLAHTNVVDLAVGIIVGSALTTLVKSFVSSFVSPLIGLIITRSQLSGLSFSIGKAVFDYGGFFNDLLSFLLTAYVIFLMIKFFNQFFASEKEETKEAQQLKLLTEIRDLLKEEKRDH